MSKYLMIDFGSTFTKLVAVDSETEDIIATASHFTTVAEDITIGYKNALNALYKKIGEQIQFDKNTYYTCQYCDSIFAKDKNKCPNCGANVEK